MTWAPRRGAELPPLRGRPKPGVGGGLDADRGRRRSDPMVRARDVAWVVISAEGECDGLLLERGRELERIGQCLQRARQGYGGALVVEGPAGIGKTVLLAAGRVAAQGEGFRVLRARGGELEREYAFGVVRQRFEPALAAVTEQERSGLLDGPPGVAARLLSLPGLGDEAMGGTAAAPDPSFAVLHGLYWLCANLAAEHPLALVVDDAHWADGASLRFLAFLLPRLEELPAAVLLGVRPAEAGASEGLLAALMMGPGTEVVTVGPLTVDGVTTLVADGLGVEPDPAFAAALGRNRRYAVSGPHARRRFAREAHRPGCLLGWEGTRGSRQLPWGDGRCCA